MSKAISIATIAFADALEHDPKSGNRFSDKIMIDRRMGLGPVDAIASDPSSR
jgi:hypothetical protein